MVVGGAGWQCAVPDSKVKSLSFHTVGRSVGGAQIGSASEE